MGKFGGENRSSLREPARINWVKFRNPGCQLSVILSNEKQLDFIFDVLIEDAYKVIKTSNSKDAITAAVDFLSSILTSYLPKEDEETNLESRIKFNLFLTKTDDSFRLQDSNKILKGGKKDDAITKTIRDAIAGLVLRLVRYLRTEIDKKKYLTSYGINAIYCVFALVEHESFLFRRRKCIGNRFVKKI